MSTPYVGEIRMFGFARVPNGWFACNGSLQSIAEYEVLYTLIGTTFGGDGVTTFGVPDLSGRVPIHQGRGQGLSNYVMGQKAGTESVTLLQTQLPQHTPSLMATTALATTGAVGTAVLPAALSGETMYVTDITGANAAVMSPNAVVSMGGNQPHDNQMPTLTVQFCIAWAGIFPSQS
ncbi:phage tail protein [Stenotrophomonas sp. LMG 10879]|uniref:phage tail protein n=1 Tax=Stenotrophomonas sp. LMG 10879 TaxID=487706 RepID=UPI000C198175|nr:tail fiber protein [Stenotrophomonas sp. LMG 10879]PII21835.1 phage tail protein [Stenotrophomonas sp. LMG 10879]